MCVSGRNKNDKRRGENGRVTSGCPSVSILRGTFFSVENNFINVSGIFVSLWRDKKEKKKEKRSKSRIEKIHNGGGGVIPSFALISIRARMLDGERFTSSNECFVRAKKMRSDELLRGTSMCHSLSTPRLFFIDSPSL